jgi:hypothetical protein
MKQIIVTVALLTVGALGILGGGAAFGQESDQTASICQISMGFEAAVRIGPSAGTVLDGMLTLDMSEDGAIDRGSFVLADGAEIPVVGQISGRAISLLFDLGDGAFVAGTGLAQDDLERCPEVIDGFVGGPLAGPGEGDLGDWRKGKPGRGVLNLGTDPDSNDEIDVIVTEESSVDIED